MKKLLFILTLFSAGELRHALAQVDPLEYPPGHPNNITLTAIQQLQSFPVPRYKPGNTLLPNFSVIDPIYFGDYKQPGVDDNTAIDRQTAIQTELCKTYNYMVTLNWFGNRYASECVKLANAHPEWKSCTMSLRAQVGGSKMWNQNFANDHYLQNSSGAFLDWDGNVTAYPYKTWRPTAPVSDYSSDGDFVRNAFAASFIGLIKPVSIVCEDAEVYPFLSNYAQDSDPVVKAAKIASGLSNFQFLSKKVRENDNAYRDKFMSLPQLAGTAYTEYRLDGHREYQFAWEQAKYITTPINGKYYPTGDFYVRWPDNYKNWISAWHGLKWVSQSRYYEIASGDKLFSEFVGAGWDANEENNVRPAQWLGLLKILNVWGNEFFYPGYFNENTTPNNPKGYAWQAATPAYAQAITSRFEDILRNGDVMPGDLVDNTSYNELHEVTPVPYYLFSSGASNILVAVRKMGSKYIITGTIQNSDNKKGSTPLEGIATINLNGRQLTFKVRRQGSTYFYDESNGTFYQLDGWHESSHPWYWSKDFEIEAENFDASMADVKTYAPAAPNYTSFQTVISLINNETADYSLTTRDAGTKYLFVKSTGTGQIECTFDAAKQIISTGGWKKINLGTVAASNHSIILKEVGAGCEIDSISITSNANKYPVSSSCTTPPAIITVSDPSPCTGTGVILSVSTNDSYLWSDGRTSQNITVYNNATYTVTVTTGGCTAISTPVSVAFHTCNPCTVPTNLYITGVQTDRFILNWDYVSEAVNGTHIFIYDRTDNKKLPMRKKVAEAPVPNRKFIDGLKSRHVYEVWLNSQCIIDSSSFSLVIPVTTK